MPTIGPPEAAVYCSCRCNGDDSNIRYCQCPSGYLCQKLVTNYGVSSGGGQLAGSYCIKDGTQFKESDVGGTTCDSVTPGPRPLSCGPQQPEGI